jgi:tRNA 2-thiouridine synthesizing protein D
VTDLVLSVHVAPDHPRSLLALNFAQAALISGQRIRQIFFYQEGILHAQLDTESQLHPSAEAWLRFAQQHSLPLVICSTVVEQDFDLTAAQLHPGYSLGGLTEFSSAVAQCERLVQF